MDAPKLACLTEFGFGLWHSSGISQQNSKTIVVRGELHLVVRHGRIGSRNPLTTFNGLAKEVFDVVGLARRPKQSEEFAPGHHQFVQEAILVGEVGHKLSWMAKAGGKPLSLQGLRFCQPFGFDVIFFGESSRKPSASGKSMTSFFGDGHRLSDELFRFGIASRFPQEPAKVLIGSAQVIAVACVGLGLNHQFLFQESDRLAISFFPLRPAAGCEGGPRADT